MWDVFMDQFEVLATKAPVMLVAGNHERDFPLSGDRYNTASDSGESHASQSIWAVVLNDNSQDRDFDTSCCVSLWYSSSTSLTAGQC